MKTSTKIITGAFLIFFILMVIYNLQMRAEYLTGNYKNPYHNYRKINLRNFDEVEINAVNMMDVSIKQGDFAVMKENGSEDSVQFTKVGRRLIINVNLRQKPAMEPVYRNNSIAITLPGLKLLKVGNVFLVNGKALANYNYNNELPFGDGRTIELANFTVDSLTIDDQTRACTVQLINNRVENLVLRTVKNASFEALDANRIQNANLQLEAGTNVDMHNIYIPHLTYTVADSASLHLSGATLKGLIKQH